MPLYSFQCNSCPKVFEYFGYLEDEIKCPLCFRTDVTKLLSNAAVVYPIGDLEFTATQNRFFKGIYHDDGYKEKKKATEIQNQMAYNNHKTYGTQFKEKI